MKKEQAAVLFIPKWFPGRNDPQNGVFILKHARAISAHYPVKIMHLCPVKSQEKRFETEFEHENNIEILHCYYRSFQSSFLRIFNLLLYLIAFYKTYNRLFPKTPPLLSHAHVFTRPAALAFILRVWKGTPYIVSEHWTIYLKGKFNDFSVIKKFTIRHLAKKSEAITAVSNILLNTMKQCGIYSKRMIVIGNAVPAPENITATKSYTKKIGLVADFDDKNKQISAVIKSFIQIADTHKDWQLHIVGGGQDEAKLHQLSTESGLKDKQIIFHGRQDNVYVYQFLRDIAFLVNFSRYETFSVILVEAILHGKPVISSKSGGPESFINDENGLLIDRDDTTKLKAAMQQMIEQHHTYDPDLVRKSIGDKFSPENIGFEFKKLYDEILKPYAQ